MLDCALFLSYAATRPGGARTHLPSKHAAFLKLPAATNTWQLPDSKSFENCPVPLGFKNLLTPLLSIYLKRKEGRLCAIFVCKSAGGYDHECP